jgi:hypothetical protein
VINHLIVVKIDKIDKIAEEMKRQRDEDGRPSILLSN